jgi:NADPH2:quinone reductase
MDMERGMESRFGTAAEYVVLPAQQAYRYRGLRPGCWGMSWNPALTAYHAVHVDGGVSGKSVLVAGGGNGWRYAIQFAKLAGRQIHLRSLAKAVLANGGADVLLNYKTEDINAGIKSHEWTGVDQIVIVSPVAGIDLQILKSMAHHCLWRFQQKSPSPFLYGSQKRTGEILHCL